VTRRRGERQNDERRTRPPGGPIRGGNNQAHEWWRRLTMLTLMASRSGTAATIDSPCSEMFRKPPPQPWRHHVRLSDSGAQAGSMVDFVFDSASDCSNRSSSSSTESSPVQQGDAREQKAQARFCILSGGTCTVTSCDRCTAKIKRAIGHAWVVQAQKCRPRCHELLLLLARLAHCASATAVTIHLFPQLLLLSCCSHCCCFC